MLIPSAHFRCAEGIFSGHIKGFLLVPERRFLVIPLSGRHTVIPVAAGHEEKGFRYRKENAQHQKYHAVLGIAGPVQIIHTHLAEYKCCNADGAGAQADDRSQRSALKSSDTNE